MCCASYTGLYKAVHSYMHLYPPIEDEKLLFSVLVCVSLSWFISIFVSFCFPFPYLLLFGDVYLVVMHAKAFFAR